MITKGSVLTVVAHANLDTLLEAAVLTLVTADPHDDTAARVFTWLVRDLVLHRSTEETLG